MASYEQMFDYSEYIAELCRPQKTHAPPVLKRKIDAYLSDERATSLAGDVRIRSMLRLLDSFEGYERSEMQKQFHNAFLVANLPHIYGPAEYDHSLRHILEFMQIDRVESQVCVSTPRRMGKTTAVSMFCAVMLYVVPDTWISVFSTGQRASTSLLDLTAKFVHMLEGGKERILKKNTEQLFLKGESEIDVRRLFSFPSSVAGLKGQGGKTIILEEASRLNTEVFSEVVVPLLGIRNTALIAISTPLDASNYYSQLLDMRQPDGELVFKVIRIQMVCAACCQLGELECMHANQLPAWKSSARSELVRTLMANDTDMYLREQSGVVTVRDNSALDPEGITALFGTTLDASGCKTLYIIIDPNGGGQSDCAILTIGYTPQGMCIVIGADTKRVTCDAQLEEYLIDYFNLMRGKFAASHLVVIIERNYGGSVLATRMQNIVASYAPIDFVSADPKGKQRVGVVTTNETKVRGRLELQKMLRMKTIALAANFVSSHNNIKHVIRSQLTEFKIVMQDLPADSKKIPKMMMSGKAFGKNDDVCMALIIAAFFVPWTIAKDKDCYVTC